MAQGSRLCLFISFLFYLYLSCMTQAGRLRHGGTDCHFDFQQSIHNIVMQHSINKPTPKNETTTIISLCYNPLNLYNFM